MRLIIVRHAKAQRDSVSGRDADRALNERGDRQAAWLAATLAEQAPPDRPALILSSPYLRARQTAEAIARATGAELRFEHALEVGRSTDGVLSAIADAAAGRSTNPRAGAIAVVGHNPQLESLLADLVRGLRERDAAFRTGEAAILDAPRPLSPFGTCTLVGRLRLPDDGSD